MKEDKIIEKTFLAVIFFISLGFRLIGLGWGLPYPYDHDGFFVISNAVRFFNGNLNPGWFIYPSFHMYFLFFVYGIIFCIGKFSGHFNSIHEFCSILNIDPSLFIISGRIVAALFGCGSVILCYILAKRLFGHRCAILSLILAILPMEVLSAHYVTTDIPLTFWFLLVFIFSTLIMEKANLKYYILAGIFTGIAGGTKYPGLGGILPLSMAHLIRLWKGKAQWKSILFSNEHLKLILALAVAGISFFASTPYVFLDYKHSIPNLAGEFHIRFTDTFDIYQRSNENQTFIYFREIFFNFGFLFVLLGLVGLLLRLKKITKGEILLLSWIIPFAIVIHISKLKPPRYFLLLSPFLVIFFANVIAGLEERFKIKFGMRKFISACALFFIFFQPLYYSIKDVLILTRPDTREDAHDWIIKNIPPCTVLAKELLWTPFLREGRYKVIYDGWSLGDHEFRWYKERDAEYFLVSKQMKDLMSHPGRPAPLHRQFYKDLEQGASLIYEVDVKDKGLFMDFHNPTVRIYRVKDRS